MSFLRNAGSGIKVLTPSCDAAATHVQFSVGRHCRAEDEGVKVFSSSTKTMRAVICLLLLCHAQVSWMRPSDLDTSVFSLDYDYESDPYLPVNLGLQEAKMVDPWTVDFRRKLASQDVIGKATN